MWIGVITNAGNSLLAQWTNEKTLHITGATAGTGRVADTALLAQTALVNSKQTASIVSNEAVNGGRKLKLQLTAHTSDYALNQFGIWANIDGGESSMLALFQTDTDAGVTIPDISESPDFAYTFYGTLGFSNTGLIEVNIDTSALVSLGTMESAINTAAAQKQDKIMVDGILKGDGAGNISAAVPGTDYGFPLKNGTSAPTAQTAGSVGQHYYAASTGKEYVCTGHDAQGYHWKQSGASDAEDLTYNGEVLSDFLGTMTQDIQDISDSLDDSKPLNGTSDPTPSTVGAIGQSYLNTQTMHTFYCTAASGGVYTWEEPAGSGVAPQVIVSVATGSAVAASCGEVSLTDTSVDGKCVFELPDYGAWSFVATLNGQTSGTEIITVDQVKQYAVTLSYFAATLTVTAENGAIVTATDGTHTYTGTCGSNNKCSLTVRYAGTYSVSARKENCTSSTVSANVTTSGNTYTATVHFITLTVTIDSGSSVTASNGATTLTGSSTGTVKFYLPNTGTWAISASKGDQSASGSVTASSYTGYTLELSYVKIFGVSWAKGTSTACSRLTKANDPNGHVTVDITTEPAPAIGNGAGSSPFDNYAPWNGMEEYNIINNAVSYKKGQSGFSRSSYDTMVYIPEFYFKIVESGGKSYFYVADKPTTGFTKHPGSGKYVGRYNTISGYFSKTGAAPLANITRSTARSGSKGKGSKWSQYDYASWCAVWLLYLVEFADFDSQSRIGRGFVDNNSNAINSGGTDSMTYHTGRPAGTNGQTAVQYRNIENPWGNVYEWIDGANFSDRAAWICTNPANYADDTNSNYTSAGVTLASSGWIKDIGFSSTFPWAFLPDVIGGSETTYIPDYLYSNTGWRVLMVGGSWSYGSYAGLFYFNAYDTSSSTNTNIGARLLFHP